LHDAVSRPSGPRSSGSSTPSAPRRALRRSGPISTNSGGRLRSGLMLEIVLPPREDLLAVQPGADNNLNALTRAGGIDPALAEDTVSFRPRSNERGELLEEVAGNV